MLQQGCWARRIRGRRRRLPLFSRIMAGAGAGVIAGCLAAGVRHLDRTEGWIGLCSPLLLAGVLLVYVGLWVGLARRPKPVPLHRK